MLDTIREIVRRAGQIMLDAGLTEGDVTAKPGHANYVTRYDVAVQEFLFQELGAAFPDAAFLGVRGSFPAGAPKTSVTGMTAGDIFMILCAFSARF